MSDVFDEPGNEDLNLDTMEVVSEASEAEVVQTEPEVQATEPSAEEVTEPAEEPKQEAPTDTSVPLATFLEEKTNRKELQNEVKGLHEKLNQFSSMREELDAMRNKDKKVEADQAFEDDPISALRSQQEELTKKVDTDINQRSEAEAGQQQFNDFQMDVAQKVEVFKQEAPDYMEALESVGHKMNGIYESMGIPQEQRAQAFEEWSVSVASQAMQNGINPGKAVYDMAIQMGYAKQQEAPTEDRLSTIQKGQEASKTLSDTGGQGEGSSLANIESMSDEEFDSLWSDMERAN